MPTPESPWECPTPDRVSPECPAPECPWSAQPKVSLPREGGDVRSKKKLGVVHWRGRGWGGFLRAGWTYFPKVLRGPQENSTWGLRGRCPPSPRPPPEFACGPRQGDSRPALQKLYGVWVPKAFSTNISKDTFSTKRVQRNVSLFVLFIIFESYTGGLGLVGPNNVLNERKF